MRIPMRCMLMCLVLGFGCPFAHAQLYPVPFDQRVEPARRIAIGTVAAKTACSDDATCTDPGGLDAGTMVPVSDQKGTVGPITDLTIEKFTLSEMVVPGMTVNYGIVVSNLGPADLHEVAVADSFPEALSSCFTSGVGGIGVSGFESIIVGDINDSGIVIPPGGALHYLSTCEVDSAAFGQMTNTATAVGELPDLDLTNNTAQVTDSLAPTANLRINKTDGRFFVDAGTPITYKTIVSNLGGPSQAAEVTVTDAFPAMLSDCSTTSVASGGASGNEVGPFSGDINDSGITLPDSSSVTYTSTCEIRSDAVGPLINIASISWDGIDPDPDNNSDLDFDAVEHPFILIRSGFESL